MAPKVKPTSLFFSIVFWTLTLNFYVFVRFAGDLSDQGEPILTIWLISQVNITGVVIGIILGFINTFNIGRSLAKGSFLNTILLNTIGYLIFFSIVIFVSSLFGNSLNFAKSFFFSTESMVTMSFLFVNSLVFHFLLQMNRMFGPGVLAEYTTGKYFNPVEEERIFMFLDLKSSTRLAEHLGHSSYSKMIQDCFTIVAKPAAKFKARIYQYVGDEVVVTWKTSQKFIGGDCIHFFFEFQEHLREKADYFNERYGVVPQFKAGLHYGRVMAAEVGKLKSEIAYHGDVLNAASRIQGLCNEYDESLLISEKLLGKIQPLDQYQSEYLGNLSLKGKDKKIKVHCVKPRN